MDELPDNLKQLEDALLASRAPGPSPDLRDRVLGQVQHELAIELRASRQHNRWVFAAAVAASVLVWMNVSISATTATDGRVQLAAAADVNQLATEIHELLPDLSEKETHRQAVLLWSGDSLLLQPELAPPSFTQKSRYGLDRLPE